MHKIWVLPTGDDKEATETGSWMVSNTQRFIRETRHPHRLSTSAAISRPGRQWRGARGTVVEVGVEDGLEGVVLFRDPANRGDVVHADCLV